MEEIEVEAQLNAIGDEMCTNCGDPIDGDPVWVERYTDPDGKTLVAFYCARCISIDGTRAL